MRYFLSLNLFDSCVPDVQNPIPELHITVSPISQGLELVGLECSSGDVPHHRFTNFTRLPPAKSTCEAQVELKWTSSDAPHCPSTNFTRLPLVKCICGAPVKLIKWQCGASV